MAGDQKAVVTAETVARVARLARIRLSETDREPAAVELTKILGFVSKLNEVDTDGVPPMTSVATMTLPMREDVVSDGSRRADALRNAPESADDSFFTVPKVVE